MMQLLLIMFALHPLVLAYTAQVGYVPLTNTSGEYNLAQDVGLIASYLKTTGSLYLTALSVYQDGLYSFTMDGEVRSLQSFTSLTSSSEGFVKTVNTYWGTDPFVDSYISSAIMGEDKFSGSYSTLSTSSNAREQGAWRAIQLLIVPSLVAKEMELAVAECRQSSLMAGVNHWDSAWAYFSGTGETVKGAGRMLYSIAQLRCYDSCYCRDTDESSIAVLRILNAFGTGQTSLLAGDCDAADLERVEIERNFIVVFAQGVLKGLYRSSQSTVVTRQRAEDYPYVLALLPALNQCSPSLAARLRENMDFSSPTTFMIESYTALIADLRAQYSCLNIRCFEVGGYCITQSRRLLHGPVEEQHRRRLSTKQVAVVGTDGCTWMPTAFPTSSPTLPTRSPTSKPSKAPTLPTSLPTRSPTREPTSKAPTLPTMTPTFKPTTSPTSFPTISPTLPTGTPTFMPSQAPTYAPSNSPTPPTTFTPTESPTTPTTMTPSLLPTGAPTTSTPTKKPSTLAPVLSSSPTQIPTTSPISSSPTQATQAPSNSTSPVQTDNTAFAVTASAAIVGGAVVASLGLIALLVIFAFRKRKPETERILTIHQIKDNYSQDFSSRD
jgi:hypothetical protein